MSVTSPTAVSRPLRIFLVENHPDTLLYVRMYLEGFGHTVLGAQSIREALEAIPAARCDVLISDIGLPDGNGWDLLHTLNAQGRAPVYAIAMSGLGMNADHKRSEEAGFRQHLLKPLHPNEFDALLAQAAAELT